MPDVPTTAQFYPPSTPPSQSVPQPPVYPFPQPGRAAPPTVPFQAPPPYMVYQQPPRVVYQQRPPSSNKNLLWLLLIPAGIIVLCVSCLGIGIVSAAVAPPGFFSYDTPTAGSAQVAQPTATDIPTDTPAPPPSTAVLGATVAEFTNAFGAPDLSSGHPFYTTQIHTIPLYLALQTSTSSNGESLVSVIEVIPIAGGFYDMTTAFQLAYTLAPSDAIAVDIVLYSNGVHEFVFKSATLAGLFPHYHFVNNAGVSVPAGTFDISCPLNPDGTTVKGCLLRLGRI